MKLKPLLLASAILAGPLVAAFGARAAVSESQFPPKTVRDLIGICAPPQGDPMLTAAINYCHGFAEGAVIVEEAHQRQRGARKLFCLPHPAPDSGAELGNFINWANDVPSRLDAPAVDGMFLYLATKYPCSKVGGSRK